LRLPTERLAVAVLCNTADADAGALAKATASEFLPTSASGVTGAASAAHDAPGVDASAGAPTEADRARMLGTYLERSSLDVRTVTQQGRELALGFGGPLRRPLDAIGPRTLRVRGTATTYELKPGATAIADKLVRTTAGETTTYERFEPISVTLAGLAEYRGRYRSVETTHDLAVDVAEGVLVSSPWGKRADGARYESVARDVFIEPGGGLVFERDKRGKVIGVVSYFNGHAAVRWTKVE
jgi:hypothetical protein